VRTVLDALVSEKATGLDISVTGGKVTLNGIIRQGGDVANAIEKIRKIDGVKDVEANIQHAPTAYGI
jgi:osmotically-inducible protein OsmY